MKEVIPDKIDQFKPEFLIYNAGTDCMENDPLGRMNLTPNEIIKRDELILQYCTERSIPILMVLSGISIFGIRWILKIKCPSYSRLYSEHFLKVRKKY